jgi:hypothetical protein
MARKPRKADQASTEAQPQDNPEVAPEVTPETPEEASNPEPHEDIVFGLKRVNH